MNPAHTLANNMPLLPSTKDRREHVKVQVRGSRHFPLSTPRLHHGCDGPPHTGQQWPAPLSSVWPYSGALPWYEFEQVHEESQGTAHAVRYDPFFTQSPAAQREEKRFSPLRALRNDHTLDPSVFSISDRPNMFRITLPGPGNTGELSGHEGRATETAHPGTISTSWEIFRPWFVKRPAHVSSCNFKGACCV